MNGCIVKTPASSANLGPGFDSLGIALDLYNVIEVEKRGEGLFFGDCGSAYQNENNLFVRSYYLTLDRLGIKKTGLWVSEHPGIPSSRGLGSSAATIVAGVLAANFLHGSPLTREELLAIALELEPHPDNLAPAMLGGFRASMVADGKAVSVSLPCADLSFAALIPPFPLSTSKARAVLPKEVLRQDAVFNLSRVALLAKGLETGNLSLIRLTMDDRLHQPYRKELIPGYGEWEAVVRSLGAAFCLSGAGPTLLCVSDDPAFAERLAAARPESLEEWRVLSLHRDPDGAVITPR